MMVFQRPTSPRRFDRRRFLECLAQPFQKHNRGGAGKTHTKDDALKVLNGHPQKWAKTAPKQVAESTSEE